MSRPYQGDVSVQDCWSALEGGADAFLVDVRTAAEWTYVGFPLVPEAARAPIFAEWQSFPTMNIDAGFARRLDAEIRAAGGSPASQVYFLCRSGARSMSSAAALTEVGYTRCFNILDGFEGAPDAAGHRGTVGGWKAVGLPWRQR